MTLGRRNWDYYQGIQTEATEFEVDDSCKEVWETGTAFLGTPKSARLTSFALNQYLDIYLL